MLKNNSIYLSLFIVSLTAGFLLVGHFTTSRLARPDDPIGQLRDQEKIAQQLVLDQTELKNQIRTLREEIEILTAQAAPSAARQTLDRLHAQIGLTRREGRGVVIQLSETSTQNHSTFSADELAIYAANLRDLVQRLWSGGATAISINGQRITALSPISFVGNSVLINDSRTVPPFEIVALGDPQILAQELNLERYLPSLAEQINAGLLDFSVHAADALTVPVYSGRLSTDHLTPVTND